MKKFLALALVLAFSLSSFAGCSNSQNSAQSAAKSGSQAADGQKVTISILSSDDFAGFRKKVIPDFEKANPNIQVNFSSVGRFQQL